MAAWMLICGVCVVREEISAGVACRTCADVTSPPVDSLTVTVLSVG